MSSLLPSGGNLSAPEEGGRTLSVYKGCPVVRPTSLWEPVPAPAPGRCISCSDSLGDGQTWRCAPCLTAVRLALGLAVGEP